MIYGYARCSTAESIPKRFFPYYAKYQAGELNIKEMSRLMECSRTTIYKYIEILQQKKSKGEE